MKIIKELQQKSGFISIESVIVSGLLLALGAWAWVRFYAISEIVIENAIDLNKEVQSVTVSGS